MNSPGVLGVVRENPSVEECGRIVIASAVNRASERLDDNVGRGERSVSLIHALEELALSENVNDPRGFPLSTIEAQLMKSRILEVQKFVRIWSQDADPQWNAGRRSRRIQRRSRVGGWVLVGGAADQQEDEQGR
ncbi:MAG: hypothetical protein V2A76_10785 [Planctomycetota bacterium]